MPREAALERVHEAAAAAAAARRQMIESMRDAIASGALTADELARDVLVRNCQPEQRRRFVRVDVDERAAA